MDFKEFQIFLCSFFGLCFYYCSLTDVVKHLQSYPILTNTLHALRSRGASLDSKISRLNDLLRSFEGHVNLAPSQGNTDQSDTGVFWCPIYGIDRELEKLFHDVGGRTSHITFVDRCANLIIDDEKLRM